MGCYQGYHGYCNLDWRIKWLSILPEIWVSIERQNILISMALGLNKSKISSKIIYQFIAD